MSVEKPGHWQSLLKSFNPHFYRYIAGQSFGRSFVYVLLLSFVLSLALSLKYTVTFKRFIPRAHQWLLAHAPEAWPKGLTEIKIENGRVSSPVVQPFTHKWGEFTFVLDTTGGISSLDEYKQGVLLLKNKVVFKRKKSALETEIREYDLAKVESFIIRKGNIDKGIIAEIINKDKSFVINAGTLKSLFMLFYRIAFIAMLLWFFIYYLNAKVTQGLFFALLALPANKILKANLKYRELLNIALYAFTPATVSVLIMALAGVNLPALWFLYCLLYSIYLILGIKDTRDNPKIPEVSAISDSQGA